MTKSSKRSTLHDLDGLRHRRALFERSILFSPVPRGLLPDVLLFTQIVKLSGPLQS